MLRLMRCSTVALLVGVPALAAAQEFEGRVTVEMNAGPNRPAMPMTILSKGGKSRMESSAGGTPVAMIMDYGAGTITTLMTAQKMYMRMDLKQTEQQMRAMAGADATEAPKYTRTGRRETIAGVSCEHVVFHGKDSKEMDVCAAKGMGFFGGPGGGLGGGRGAGGGGIPAGYEQLMKDFKDGFFPLKIEQVEGTTRRQILVVTKVEREAVDAALFTVPQGFTEMQMPAMPGRP
jgi:hypothetical protein